MLDENLFVQDALWRGHFFMQRDERCYKKVASFFVDFQYIAHTRCSVFINVKFVNTISSHAYAYARSTGVFAFLLSQVSQHFHNVLVIKTLHYAKAYFNKSLIQVPQNSVDKTWKRAVLFCHLLLKKSTVLASISPLVWHLWQQKNNIAVGTRARRCIHPCAMRAYVDVPTSRDSTNAGC